MGGMAAATATPLPLTGRTIGVTADRRWREQADLFEARGATVMHGPTMRTVDLSADEALRDATQRVIDRPPDYVVATTGMGMQLWLEAAAVWDEERTLMDGLARAKVVARGAKASSAVKRAGMEVWWKAPHETMDEIVERLRSEPAIGDAVIALQLFDPNGHPSTDALRSLVGPEGLVEVPVYRWLLPEDPEPAMRLIEAVVAGRVDAVTFTSQPAVHHLFRMADDAGHGGQLRDALNTTVLPGCIGAVCAEALQEEGVSRLIFPEPPRLPAMVRKVTELLAGAGS
jgi:uroporphyrinogen-III synthase